MAMLHLHLIFSGQLKNKRVQVNKGGSEGYVRAIEIRPGQEYIIDQTKDANSQISHTVIGVAYYRETGAGVEVWPSTAADVKYPYLKAPAVLGAGDNTDLPDDIEDLTILHAFERLMGTKRGDLELAVKLARDRGFNIPQYIQQKDRIR